MFSFSSTFNFQPTSFVRKKFSFHPRNEFLREVVQFHRECPQAMHEPVVAEHRGNRHEQAGDRCDERGGNAGLIEGIAKSRPATVVMSAAETPGAIVVSVAEFDCAMLAKVLITPQTVPSSPMNGAPLTAIASKIKPDSSFKDSCATTFSMARLVCSMFLMVTFGLRWSPGPRNRASSCTQPA